MRRYVSAAALVLAVVAAPAAAQPAKVKAPDACSLVTKPEAETAIGAAVSEPTRTAEAGAMPGTDRSACNYDSPSTMGFLKIAATVYSPAAAQVLAAYRARCAKKETVAGLGDVACWYDASHGEMQVVKGSVVLVIRLNRKGGAAEPLKTAAAKAISRLP